MLGLEVGGLLCSLIHAHTSLFVVRSQPLEMGFSPRSSWHPEFRQFFDDWAEKMKKSGLDPTKTTLGYDGAYN